jgi:hypothetical protein
VEPLKIRVGDLEDYLTLVQASFSDLERRLHDKEDEMPKSQRDLFEHQRRENAPNGAERSGPGCTDGALGSLPREGIATACRQPNGTAGLHEMNNSDETNVRPQWEKAAKPSAPPDTGYSTRAASA